MANVRKKVINNWDGGIKTSPRDNNPDISDGSQMIKGFDVYKDPKKLIPMQSWESFTNDSEKAYNIRAMGGLSDEVYGLGSGVSNWLGAGWGSRIRVDVTNAYHSSNSLPMHLDMSLLPNDFWDNIQSNAEDVRVTSDTGVSPHSVHIENLDIPNKTGDMWIRGNVIDVGTSSFNTRYSYTNSGSSVSLENSSAYAVNFPVTLSGQPFNYLTFNLLKTGSPSDLIVDLYTDNAGVPGTLVVNLGTIDAELVNFTTANDVNLSIADTTYTGSYHFVLHATTADGSNTYQVSYSNAGTKTISRATNVGLTAWTTVDVTSTPYYVMKYYTNTVSEKYFYIYYNNPDVIVSPYGLGAISYIYGGMQIFKDSNLRWWYTFGDDVPRNKYYGEEDVAGDESFTTDPQNYVDGLFGRAIQTAGLTITTDNNDDVGLTGNDVSLSFMVYTSTWAENTIYRDIQSDFEIKLTAAGKIQVTFNGSVANTACTSTLALSLNKWHVVDVKFNDDTTIYIDGVKEVFNINDGTYDGAATNNGVVLNSGIYHKLAQIAGYNDDITDEDVYTKYNNFIRNDFFTVGSPEDIGDVALTYDGVQLYKKNISSGDWEEYTESGFPVKSTTKYPVNAFVDDTGTYFVVSNSPENQGFLYLAQVDALTVLDSTHLLLSILTNNSSKIVLQPDTPTDNTTYFNYGSSALASVGDPGSNSEYTVPTAITSIVPWRDYLAIGYTRRNRAFIDIWDLASSGNTERIDCGNGNIRIVGNASDILFAVIDNFVDDAVKSANKPTVEIRAYVGNGQSEKTHVLEIPAIITSYDDDWERAVSSFKLRRNTQTLFYARLPKDSTGATFNEGFWAVGKNSKGELCLTLQIDTEGLGMPENVFGFAQQVFFIQKDGGIKKLSNDTYTNTSLFTTLKMNEGNTEIEKKLMGIEIITEPLEDGQTISIYYKMNGDVSRTKICDFSGEDEISYETNYDINGTSLPHYKEIEFDIESTGGKSAVLEFNYKYEYLSDIV